jgi:hypothetical protein
MQKLSERRQIFILEFGKHLGVVHKKVDTAVKHRARASSEARRWKLQELFSLAIEISGLDRRP